MHIKTTVELILLPQNVFETPSSYLGDGHGDVEELSPASLRDGAREEQLQPVFRKQRLLVLKTHRR